MRRKISVLSYLVITLVYCIFSIDIFAQQPIPSPDLSQKASITQRIGVTDIIINYHRPAVKGRVIWGNLVPYNQVWRAGANENTTISFSDPVTIAGKVVPEGTYGLHMIPAENEWTIILSKFSKGWGSYFYKPEEDLMRFTVKPASSEFMEYLTYSFDSSEPTKTQVSLCWEKLKIPFDIEVNVNEIVVNQIKDNLRGLNGFSWQPFQQAAAYCINSNTHLDDAEEWIDKAMKQNNNFMNMCTKSQLLDLKGNPKEADDLLKQAYAMGSEAEINNFGYTMLQAKKIDKAIEAFKLNTDRFPGSWNAYDSLGEGYLNKGEKNLAKECYKKAFDMVKDETQKKRIDDVLKTL